MAFAICSFFPAFLFRWNTETSCFELSVTSYIAQLYKLQTLSVQLYQANKNHGNIRSFQAIFKLNINVRISQTLSFEIKVIFSFNCISFFTTSVQMKHISHYSKKYNHANSLFLHFKTEKKLIRLEKCLFFTHSLQEK